MRINADLANRGVIDTCAGQVWRRSEFAGIEELPSHRFGTERVRLERWSAGAATETRRHNGGQEVFVLAGDWRDGFGVYREGMWIRNPDASVYAASSRSGGLLLVKSGHLPEMSRASGGDNAR